MYSAFDDDLIRLRKVGGVTVAELFHGPTLSFKDLALQFLGALLEILGSRREKHYKVVVATSGDTGSAAMAALKGKENVSVYVLYPAHGVSLIQELQMTTSASPSSFALAVDGSFDDCQQLVKDLFSRGNIPNMTAMNSINIARVLAQVVYYVYIYLHSTEQLEEISVSVPTGNFGNVLVPSTVGRLVRQADGSPNPAANAGDQRERRTSPVLPDWGVRTETDSDENYLPVNGYTGSVEL